MAKIYMELYNHKTKKVFHIRRPVGLQLWEMRDWVKKNHPHCTYQGIVTENDLSKRGQS